MLMDGTMILPKNGDHFEANIEGERIAVADCMYLNISGRQTRTIGIFAGEET